MFARIPILARGGGARCLPTFVLGGVKCVGGAKFRPKRVLGGVKRSLSTAGNASLSMLKLSPGISVNKRFIIDIHAFDWEVKVTMCNPQDDSILNGDQRLYVVSKKEQPHYYSFLLDYINRNSEQPAITEPWAPVVDKPASA